LHNTNLLIIIIFSAYTTVNTPQSIYTVWVKLLDKTLFPDDDKLFD